MVRIQTVSDLVKQIKTAVQSAQQPLEESGLTITWVGLEIKTTIVASGQVGAKFKIIPVGLSGRYEHSEIQTITLSMVPAPAGIELMAPVSDDLRDAIDVVSKAVQEASRSSPVFELKEATVALKLGVTKDGSIEIIVGAEAKDTTTHSVTLTLRRRGAGV